MSSHLSPCGRRFRARSRSFAVAIAAAFLSLAAYPASLAAPGRGAGLARAGSQERHPARLRIADPAPAAWVGWRPSGSRGVAPIECPLTHTDVKAEISGFLARVHVTQTFKNPRTVGSRPCTCFRCRTNRPLMK